MADPLPLPISLVVHGDSGVGKSWLGDTTPPPRLVLDAEGGSRFTPSKKVMWNPQRDEPPEHDGSWDTCVVLTREFGVLSSVFQWLNSGQHPFKSLILDSLTEIQARVKDTISGTQTPSERDWGAILIKMESMVRHFRDLTLHPTNPLEAVVLLALTRDQGGKWRPYLQGQISTKLPQYVDVVGYMYVDEVREGESIDDQTTHVRRLLTQPRETFVAKDRTDTFLENGGVLTNPNVQDMIDRIYSKEQ